MGFALIVMIKFGISPETARPTIRANYVGLLILYTPVDQENGCHALLSFKLEINVVKYLLQHLYRLTSTSYLLPSVTFSIPPFPWLSLLLLNSSRESMYLLPGNTPYL
jgi:hypothetical protein